MRYLNGWYFVALIFGLIAIFLVGCAGGDAEVKTVPKDLISLHESGIHRYIDEELGVACYTYSRTNASFMMSCVSIDKDKLP